MSPFPRDVYRPLQRYSPDRRPIAVDLSDNTNRWGTHPGALRVLREAAPADLTRYPSVYADALREAVARRFHVPPEAVVTGCGSDDLLDSTFRAACDPGEGVAYLPPTFAMVEIFARVTGLTLRPVARGVARPVPGPDPEEGAFPPLPSPEAFLEHRPGLVYLCRPNNPTGEVSPRAWVDELLDAAGALEEGGGYGDGTAPVILVDEAYADFMEGEDRDDLLRLAAGSRRLVVLRTLSKAYGLAGLRVGFAVGAPEVVAEIEKARGPYKVTRVSEAAAVAALEDREGWIPDVVAESRAERAYLETELRARGFRVLPSGANFLCLPLEGGPLGPDGTSAAVTARFRSSGVAVRPFPALAGVGEAIRVSVGPRREMDRFLNALDGMLP
jgi:histidinol-phosphate aminotransferase